MDEIGISSLSINGGELGYSALGTAPDKPPLVFVHGYAMRSTAGPYQGLLSLLAEQFSVYALDLRGHGASADCLDAWSFETLADDVAAFILSLELSSPVFVGHSFGAVVGLYAELRHPGSFAKLCLLSPGPADHRHDPPEALNFMVEHGRNRGMLRGGFGGMFVQPQDEWLESTLDAVTLLDPQVHRALQQCNPGFSIDHQLKDVATPSLLIVGERDTVVSAAVQRDMARKLPHCRERTFPDEGHMMAIEKPAETANAIIDFVGDKE